MKLLIKGKKYITSLKKDSVPPKLSLDYFSIKITIPRSNVYQVRFFLHKTKIKSISISKTVWRGWNLESFFKNNGFEFPFGYNGGSDDNNCFIKNEKTLQLINALREKYINQKNPGVGNEIRSTLEANNYNFKKSVTELILSDVNFNIEESMLLDYHTIKLF